MKRDRWKRYAGLIRAAVAIPGGIAGLWYVHLWDAGITEGKTLIDIAQTLGWNHLWLALAAFLLILQSRVEQEESTVDRSAIEEALDRAMEALVRAYAFPESWELHARRVYCHRYNPKDHTLEAVASASSVRDANERVPIPTTGTDSAKFVVTHAYTQKKVCLEEVDGDEAAKIGVWSEVKTVIAVPIYHPAEHGVVLGTLSMDTSLGKGDSGFENRNTSNVLINAAEAVGYLWTSY